MSFAELPLREPGSFRDPAGQIFHHRGRIYRTIAQSAQEDWGAVLRTGLLNDLAQEGVLVPWQAADAEIGVFTRDGQSPAHVLEVSRLPIISYPYEWSFSALKAAALLHLDIQIRALDAGVALSDGTAYNVQFIGRRPVFIDHLSFKPYRDGDFWWGQRQFIESFVNPLLLWSMCDVPFHGLYRSSLEGIPNALMAKLLPSRSWLNWRVVSQILLPARIDRGGARSGSARGPRRAGYRALLQDLRHWVGALDIVRKGTTWAEYETDNSYSDADSRVKGDFTLQMVEKSRPPLVVDFGCNRGLFSLRAAEAGAESVIGLEGDPVALEGAFARAQTMSKPFLPLYQDLCNPSPGLGWQLTERRPLGERITRDKTFVLGLAILHHLAIGRNIPLADAVRWLTGFGTAGIIEFVPKTDPMVQIMLANRQDIFADYTQEAFLAALEAAGCREIERKSLSSGRLLLAYERVPA